MTMSQSNPTFKVFCGPMFSSKTTSLMLELERYRFRHKRVVAFKPLIDDRYKLGAIVTHSGWSTSAYTVESGADILEVLEGLDEAPDVIAVDEAFMINNVAEVLEWLYRNGINIVVSTLDISSSGKSFNDVGRILTWATHVVKCPAVCTVCGRDAFYTHKKNVDEDENVEIAVGGVEMYEPRCFNHHIAIDKREKIHT